MQADGFVTCKKSLNVLSLYVKDSLAHFSRIVETTSFGRFLHMLQKMAEYEHVGKFPTTFLETFLTGLTTIFEYEEAVQAETVSEFVRWLVTFQKTSKDNNTIQILLARMLTMLLNHNSPLHLHAGWPVCVRVLPCDGERLRPERDRFQRRIPRRKRVLLCTILLHLRNDHPISRPAAHKLMYLVVSRQRHITCKSLR
jgi:hypothetical protein